MQLKYTSGLMLIFLSISSAFAQPSTMGNTGSILIPTGLANENIGLIARYNARATIPVVVPRDSGLEAPNLAVPLDSYVPCVLDQGEQGSCTAFAVAEALTIRENIRVKRKFISGSKPGKFMFSPAYLWLNTRELQYKLDSSCAEGVGYSDIIDCLYRKSKR